VKFDTLPFKLILIKRILKLTLNQKKITRNKKYNENRFNEEHYLIQFLECDELTLRAIIEKEKEPDREKSIQI
jgi:hypothetical protein